MTIPCTKWICGSLGLSLALLGVASADGPDSGVADVKAQQSAYRSSIEQEKVQQQTDKIQAGMGELMAELKLNGLDSGDLTLLSDASGHLRRLSQEDMQKVINALQSASMNAQAPNRQQSMLSAMEGQKEVLLKLKSLAVDLAAQEFRKELPSKLESLIARQSANIRQTSTLGTATAQQLNAQQKATYGVVSSEQGAIGGEIDLLFKVLAAAPDVPPKDNAPANGDDSPISTATLGAMNASSLKETAGAATQLTLAGPFQDAVTKQNAVRDELTSALRAALSNIDEASRLEDAKAQLNQMIRDQEDLAEVTRQSKMEGSILAERQDKIGDRTSVTQALLKPLSATAFAQVNQAQQAMAQSSDQLAKAATSASTASTQQTVIDDLMKATALLDQEIAAAQKQETKSPTDKLADLQKLQSEINQAQKNPAPPTADLQKLQQDAAATSPQAASQIADAADQSQKPQPDGGAVQKALAQADDTVQKQENAMKQVAQQYQALSEASKELSQAQEKAAEADRGIQDKGDDLTPVARDLTQAQDNVDHAAKTQAQSQPQSGVPSDTEKALQEASKALKDAAMSAVQAQAGAAQAQVRKAMAAMQKAQTGLGQSMAQLGQGQGPDPSQSGQLQPPNQEAQGQSQTAQGKSMASDAPQESGQVLGGVGGGGVAQVVGKLKAKDRDAISQYQAEKSPPEYAPLIQQYLKNLADTSESH